MTRRRTLGLIFGLLIVVYVASAAFTVSLVQSRLTDAVDEDLRTAIEGLASAVDLGLLDGVELQISDSERALVVIDGRTEDMYVPAGSRVDPKPHPDLSASMIVSRVGEPFETGSIDGNTRYRVLTAALADGRYLAVAQPLDNLRDVVATMRLGLLITLFAVVAVLGLAFWLILRATLRPYDDMIATADAIAHGDLDRRASPTARLSDIERLAGSLNFMLDRIQDSFRAKESAETRLKQFLADASHELRTPLTTIRGYSELYLSGAATDSEAVDTQMSRINAESARMGRLVDDLLMLARLDDAGPTRRERIDLRPIVRDAVADAGAAGPHHPIAASLGSFAATIDGDTDTMRQVVTNLLANARIHTPAGTAITVTLAAERDDIVLTVSDDGPGMDVDTAAHAFDRFYRAARADARAGRGATGTGLGLAIVAAAVDAHSGTIRLDTALGRGCAVVVHLPRAPAVPDGATSCVASSDTPG